MHHATTGEPGGLWRARGRAPQTLFGIGFTAYGFGEARPFERTNEDSAYSWVFEGVDEKAFGDYGLFFGGAGGFELDGVDARVGTEPTSSSSRPAPAFRRIFRRSKTFCRRVRRRCRVRTSFLATTRAAARSFRPARSPGA